MVINEVMWKEGKKMSCINLEHNIEPYLNWILIFWAIFLTKINKLIFIDNKKHLPLIIFCSGLAVRKQCVINYTLLTYARYCVSIWNWRRGSFLLQYLNKTMKNNKKDKLDELQSPLLYKLNLCNYICDTNNFQF